MLRQKSLSVQPMQRKIFAILLILVFCGLFFYLRSYYWYLICKIINHFRIASTYYDFYDQWKFCAITFHKVDPYTQIGAAVPAIPEIGTIREDWGTSPWGLISGNLFYFGFLPFRAARWAYLFVCIASLAALAAVLFLKVKKESLFLALAAAVVTICSNFNLLSVFYENAGMACCSFVIIACQIAEKRPYLSGVLLGFALVKPQVALPVCLVLFLLKRLKPLIVAAGMNIVFFLSACAFTKSGPVKLLTEFLQIDVGGTNQYFGIFNPVCRLFSVSTHTSVYLSMIFCIALLIPVVLISKKYFSDEMTPFIYFVPCVITTFWSYSGVCDWSILLLPCCLLMIDIFKTKRTVHMLFSGAFLVF
ncbi:MAG: DUF2029 domain-containing protein, partial [Clostridia bacterium]|nr:DUF2029 domain-containing protein [Clostridia bacterium]